MKNELIIPARNKRPIEGKNIKFITPSPAVFLTFKLLLLLFGLLVSVRVEAARNPANYSISVKTASKTFSNYCIASLTDSTVTIYKSRRLMADSITLRAGEIVSIVVRNSQTRALNYIVPFAVFTAGGNVLGRVTGAALSKGFLDLTLIGELIFTGLGMASGVLVGAAVDAFNCNNYKIEMDPGRFLNFRGKFK